MAPGVIDQDSTGEIKVMTHSPNSITVIHSGQQIAQLILLPLARTGQTKLIVNEGIRVLGLQMCTGYKPSNRKDQSWF